MVCLLRRMDNGIHSTINNIHILVHTFCNESVLQLLYIAYIVMILNDCKYFRHSSHQEAKFIIQPFHDKIVTTSTNKGELLAFEFSSLGPCSFPLVFEHLLCRNLLLETSHLERSSVSHQSQLRPDLVPVIGSLMIAIHLSHTQTLNNILAGVLDFMEQL